MNGLNSNQQFNEDGEGSSEQLEEVGENNVEEVSENNVEEVGENNVEEVGENNVEEDGEGSAQQVQDEEVEEGSAQQVQEVGENNVEEVGENNVEEVDENNVEDEENAGSLGSFMNGLSNSSGGGRKKKHVPKTINVFLYGIEHIEKLRNIVDNNEIISNKAYIMNYIKFFCGFDEKLQSSVVSIINMNDVKTRGSMVTITEDEYDLLIEYYGSNYTEEDVKIFAFKNIKNN